MALKVSSVTIFFVIAGLTFGCRQSLAVEATCREYRAPLTIKRTLPLANGEVLNPVKEWGVAKNDSGVVVSGYVSLIRRDGQLIDVLHGVDLFNGNEFIKARFERCKPDFAIIKLDGAFESTVKRLEAISPSDKKVQTIPYYWMSVDKKMLTASYYYALSADPGRMKIEMDQAGRTGQMAGEALKSRLTNIDFSSFINVDDGGSPLKVVGVDVEYTLQNAHCPSFNENNKDCLAQRDFGKIYARQFCSFAKALEPEAVPLMYTTPSVYYDYLRFASPEDRSCIVGLPIWAARTSPRADDVIINSEQAQALCHSAAGNRCIVHQYTHRGELGLDEPTYRELGWHVDLNRKFPIKTVVSSDGKTRYFVRRDPD